MNPRLDYLSLRMRKRKARRLKGDKVALWPYRGARQFLGLLVLGANGLTYFLWALEELNHAVKNFRNRRSSCSFVAETYRRRVPLHYWLGILALLFKPGHYHVSNVDRMTIMPPLA